MSPKGRHAKSKARISAYEALVSQEAEKRDRDLEIFIPPVRDWAIWSLRQKSL